MLVSKVFAHKRGGKCYDSYICVQISVVSGVVPAEVSWSSLKQVGIINLSLMVQPLELLGTANVGGEGGGGRRKCLKTAYINYVSL